MDPRELLHGAKGAKGPVWETLAQLLQLQLDFLNYLPQLFRKLYSS